MGTSISRKRAARTLHGRDDRAMSETDLSHREKKSRQQPGLSCYSCRARKLRCDREKPCSNCIARNVECLRQGDAQPTVPSRQEEETSTTDKSNSHKSLQGSRSSVESRLERLEAVMGLQLSRNTQSVHHTYGPSGATRIPSESHNRMPISNPGFELASSYPDVNAPPCPRAAQATSDVAHLERVIVTQDELV
jgi:hypothetical protein